MSLEEPPLSPLLLGTKKCEKRGGGKGVHPNEMIALAKEKILFSPCSILSSPQSNLSPNISWKAIFSGAKTPKAMRHSSLYSMKSAEMKYSI